MNDSLGSPKHLCESSFFLILFIDQVAIFILPFHITVLLSAFILLNFALFLLYIDVIQGRAFANIQRQDVLPNCAPKR